jgi:putative sterol carrier protein
VTATKAKRSELGGLIDGKSDDEIVTGALDMGVDKVLGPIFDGMRDAFMPKKAKGESAVIQYDVDVGGKVFTFQVKVHGGACTTTRDGREPARLTIAAKLPDFLRLMAGQLHGVQAFLTGRVKLTGEMLLAPKMQSWFLKPGE